MILFDIEDYLDQKDISTIDENVDIVFVITHKKKQLRF